MSNSIKAYRDLPIFRDAFIFLGQNPILAVLVGVIVTGIIQSSSASLAILQTIASAGLVNTSSAIFIALGQNIGTCVTTIISASGANRIAKRSAYIHLIFNIIGVLAFMVLAFVIFAFRPDIAQAKISALSLSVFNTVFNIGNTLILFPLPMVKLLIRLSYLIIKENDDEKLEVDDVSITAKHLDVRLLNSPILALETVKAEVLRYGRVVEANLERAYSAFVNMDNEKVENCIKKEKEINKINTMLTEYVVELSKFPLSDIGHENLDHLLYTISNIERVGDHAENMAELTEQMLDTGIDFNEEESKELSAYFAKIIEAYKYSLAAYEERNNVFVEKTFALEDEIDRLDKELRASETERLKRGNCPAVNGAYFLDALSNLERVSDHATNIAEYVQAGL